MVDKDFGIYTNVRESGNKWTDGKHKMYYADCTVCGQTVERRMYDLVHFNKICQHGGWKISLNVNNDMSKGFLSDDYNQRVYDLWRHMIMRTTPEYWEKYPTYTGTIVSEEWRTFSNFYNDIQELDGYEMWRDNPGQRIMLDKDTKVPGNKHYSKETCCFLTHKESNQDVHSRHPEMVKNLNAIGKEIGKKNGKPVIATNKKTQESKYFNSQKECSRELGIPASHIWMCLSNEPKYESHKSAYGWTFEWADKQ